MNRIFSVNKDPLEVVSVFDTSVVDEVLLSGSKALGHAMKVLVVRNSVLVLFSRIILEFNSYTHTLTNSIHLPVPTLDFTLL